MRALWCCVMILCLIPLQAQQQNPTLVSRVQININAENASRVGQLGLDLTHGTYIPGKFYISDLTQRQIDAVRAAGFDLQVLIEDVTTYYQKRPEQRKALSCQENIYDYPTPVNFANGGMGGFYTYSEILDAMDLMHLLYPNLVSMRQKVSTQTTSEGRSLYWVRISDNPDQDEAEPEVLYTALHHAREPMSMMQMIYFMWHLLENYETDPEAAYLINNTELYFIPCVNPDGYIYNQTVAPDGGGYWRKNKRDNDGDGVFDEGKDGVDLNRNYGYQWGVDNDGSSGHPSSEVYRGPSAFSEPETQAIRDFVQAHQFHVALNYHSFGNYILYPWGYTDELNPEIDVFRNYGELYAIDNDFKTGTSMETVGYATNGSSDDWMYGARDIYAMTIELGDEDDGFWPQASQIIPLCQASLKNNLALAHLPHQYALATEVDRGFFVAREGDLNIAVKRYGSSLGDMALTVISLSPKLTIDGTIHEVSLGSFENEAFAVPYALDASAKGGDAFSFVIILDNGFYEYRDTVTKVLAGEVLAFQEDGEALTEWGDTDWGITDEDAHSGSHSLTDSPYGPSLPGVENVIAIADPIDLTHATNAVLEFWAKWEIEELIDYAQVQISTDGFFYEPLCGQYSKLGSVFQVPEPIYDGVQTDWVKESIDLTPYVGNQVYLRFIIATDAFLNLDGIYVDDLHVYVYDEDITSVKDLQHNNLMRIWPNPASQAIQVQLERPARNNSWLSATNAVGQEIYHARISGAVERIATSQWPVGLYQVSIFEDGVIVATQKVVIQ